MGSLLLNPPEMSKVSIITINRNNSSGLVKTIESVVNQTFTGFEYLIIDGGSTDDSVEVIKKYGSRISYWISEPDNGIYNAMNKGILKAQGEYLLFLNSGDTLAATDVLRNIVDLHLTEDLIYGNLIISDNGKKAVHKFPDKVDYSYLFSETIGHPNSFIKRDLFQRIGLYNENLKIVSDWEFFLKAIVIYKTTYRHVDVPVSVFSLDGASSLSTNSEKIRIERNLVLHTLFSRFNTDFHNYPSLFESKVADIYNFLSKNKVLYSMMKRVIKLYLTGKGTFKNVLAPVLYSYRRFLELLIPSKYKDLHSIPVIINNYNRVKHLKSLINWLENNGFTNIYVIDNSSTYPPLIKYYNDEFRYKIFRLDQNMGHLAIWQTDIYKEFINDFYIYTDPDVIPVEECPGDFINYFMKLLRKYPKVCKVGFSLKIDDLPECYSKREEVINWELQNYQNEIEPEIFLSSIDTTFALYRPREKGDWRIKALRTGFPYQARHLPWYEDDSRLSEEDLYYINSKLPDVGHWS